MYSDIHRRLIKKMVLGWLLLSVAIGGIVAFTELERIDHYVVDLVKLDSAKLTDAYHSFFHEPTAQNRAKLESQAGTSLHERHFAMVEVYDSSKIKVLGSAQERIEPIISNLEAKQHTFLMGATTDYMRIFHGKSLYLKIVSPIFDSEEPTTSTIIGWFEGIYQVPEGKMREIGLWLAWSIVQVILAILLTTVILYPVIIGMNKDLIKRSLELSDANLGMLQVLGGAVAKRDSDTNAHNYRVTMYAIRLAEELGLGKAAIQALVKGAFLHDVGKIGISDTILLKPAKLTDEEFKIMMLHVQHGVDIIKHYRWLDDAVAVVRYHHEKYDGSGYLSHLKGTDIPVDARIFAVADVFDALTSKRPYKEPFSYEKSIAILQESSGTHFDPKILQSFITIAAPLYETLSGNDDQDYLKTLLNEMIRKYFK